MGKEWYCRNCDSAFDDGEIGDCKVEGQGEKGFKKVGVPLCPECGCELE